MVQEQRVSFDWAILGTGVVARKFALDLCHVEGAVLHSVASRKPDNATRFARDLSVDHAAENYASAVQGADAVYIATPPAQHEAHALLAIQAGKAVLIEKPFALDADAARRIAQAAKAADVFCMEAMWTRFQPLLGSVRARLEAGEIGELRGFEAAFLAANTPDPAASSFDPDRGGGALMHRGVYPLSLARFLMGPIAASQSFGRLGTTGVDEDSALILRHNSGAISTLRASLRVSGADGISVYGTKGTLHFSGPIWRPTGAVLTRTYPGGSGPGRARRFEAFRESSTGMRLSGALKHVRHAFGRGQTRINVPFSGNGYRHEALVVMDAVQLGQTQSELMPLCESIEIMEIIDQARTDWATGDT